MQLITLMIVVVTIIMMIIRRLIITMIMVAEMTTVAIALVRAVLLKISVFKNSTLYYI